MRRFRFQSGFSLIELIVVVVLIGVLAAAGGILIVQPIEAYDDQVRRQQLVDQGELALRQIARDVRRALPNSVRVTAVGAGFAVEMINSVDGARYRDEIGGNDYVNNTHVLDFIAADTQFNLLGNLSLASAAQLAAGNERLVIYNTSPNNIYTEAVDVSDFQGIITRGDMSLTLTTPDIGPDDDEDNIVMSVPFLFTQQSPGQRAYIVDGSISYICDPGTNLMSRYTDYGYRATQPTVAADFGVSPTVDPVVSQLATCDMTYTTGTAERGGILSIEITIGNVPGESVSLLHQIHVVNVP